MDFAVLIPLMGILLVMIPVAGVTFILAARFAVKPIAEALRDGGGSTPQQQAQIEDLKEQVMLLAGEVQRLQEGQAFDRELIQGVTDPHAPR